MKSPTEDINITEGIIGIKNTVTQNVLNTKEYLECKNIVGASNILLA